MNEDRGGDLRRGCVGKDTRGLYSELYLAHLAKYRGLQQIKKSTWK